jgi:hypothetical protein
MNSCLAFVHVGLGPVVARARVLAHEAIDLCAQAVVRDSARCTSQELDRGAQGVARGGTRCASEVLDRSARPLPAANAREGARCASKVLDRCARPLPAARRAVS